MIDPIVQIYQLLALALLLFASFKVNLLNPSLSISIKVIDTIPVKKFGHRYHKMLH